MTFFKAGAYVVNLDHIIYSLYTTEPTAEGQFPAPGSATMLLTFVGGAQLELKGAEAEKIKSILSEHS